MMVKRKFIVVSLPRDIVEMIDGYRDLQDSKLNTRVKVIKAAFNGTLRRRR